jgi:hypothetical protein
MDYQKLYDSLIARARNRKLTGYCESHHIVPKCIGGTNDKSNLVDLTPEEHFLCHQLLYRIYKGTVYEHKLLYSVHMMTVGGGKVAGRPLSKLKRFAWIRKRMAIAMSLDKKGIPNPAMSARMKGKPGNKKGKVLSLESRRNISESHKGLKYPNKKPQTLEVRKQISATLKKNAKIRRTERNGGIDPHDIPKQWNWSEESKEKMRKPKVRASCIGCRKETANCVIVKSHKHCFINYTQGNTQNG